MRVTMEAIHTSIQIDSDQTMRQCAPTNKLMQCQNPPQWRLSLLKGDDRTAAARIIVA